MPDWITKYWVEWVFGLVAAGIIAYCRKIAVQVKHERAEQKALRDGMRSLLRRQIIADCEKSIEQGYCDTNLKSTIDDMYLSYHALGGNGVIAHLHAQVMNLSTVKGIEHND